MEYTQLKNVCTIKMGQSPVSSSYNENEEGLPFFQGNADFGKRYPIARVWCDSPIKKAYRDDILISVRAPIGAVNYVNEDCCIGRGLAAITPDRNKVSLEYIYWFLKGKEQELVNKGTGSTFKAISRKVLEEIMLPYIGTDEQNGRAEILEKIDRIIEKKERELSYMDDLIQARFVEMFGDPRTNSKGFQTKKGNELFKISNGKAVPNNNRFKTGIPAYGGNGISWYTDKVLYKYDTIVIGRVGFQSGNVHLVKGPIWITDNAMYISDFLDDSLSLFFLYEMMEQIDFTRHQDAGDLKKVTQKPFMDMDYIVPPKKLQNEFADFVRQTDKSKLAIQKELDKTQLLFDSLMQEYFG